MVPIPIFFKYINIFWFGATYLTVLSLLLAGSGITWDAGDGTWVWPHAMQTLSAVISFQPINFFFLF